MITIGMKLRFRPAGQTDSNFFPEAKKYRVTGTVIAVHPNNITVEYQTDGGPIREAFGIRKGLLQDRSLEVVHGKRT